MPCPCHRYISDDIGGVALHPVDLIDAATGTQVGMLTDPNLITISPGGCRVRGVHTLAALAALQ